MKKYDLYDQGNFLGTYTSRQMHESIGISIKNVSQYADTEMRYQKRYQIETNVEESFKYSDALLNFAKHEPGEFKVNARQIMDICKEWDEMILLLRR